MNFLGSLNNQDSGKRKAQQSYSSHKFILAYKAWESDFGFKDRNTANVNIKIYLNENVGCKGILVEVNGKQENRIKDESLSKEQLAEKPVKFMTEFGRHLSISFNLKKAQLTLKHNGEDVEKLPEAQKELKICRNKIMDSSTADQRYVNLISI